VEGQENPPVETAEQPTRNEPCSLYQPGAPLDRFDLPLQPGSAGDFHLGLQQQPPEMRLDLCYTKEIKRLTGSQFLRVSSAPPQADSPEQLIDPSSYIPGPASN